MRSRLWILAATAVVATACKAKDQPADRGQSPSQPTMGAMKTDSMPMSGDMGMGVGSMMPAMRAHMDSMAHGSPQQMSTMMAAHDRMLSQMMDRMGADMRSMNMAGDARWNALVDSVKADLADLPGLQGSELAARMKAHAARVERLMAMHEAMMKQ